MSDLAKSSRLRQILPAVVVGALLIGAFLIVLAHHQASKPSGPVDPKMAWVGEQPLPPTSPSVMAYTLTAPPSLGTAQHLAAALKLPGAATAHALTASMAATTDWRLEISPSATQTSVELFDLNTKGCPSSPATRAHGLASATQIATLLGDNTQNMKWNTYLDKVGKFHVIGELTINGHPVNGTGMFEATIGDRGLCSLAAFISEITPKSTTTLDSAADVFDAARRNPKTQINANYNTVTQGWVTSGDITELLPAWVYGQTNPTQQVFITHLEDGTLYATVANVSALIAAESANH